MPLLDDRQIDYIYEDITRRGIEIEDLRNNLLDHICCILESEMPENANFEQYYSSVIKRFFRKELKELQEETTNLLTFSHSFYAMKKTLVTSGAISAIGLCAGSVMKLNHIVGANKLFFGSFVIFILVFLPVFFTLKFRDSKDTRDKWMLLMGLVVTVISLTGVLFKLMWWPYANVLMKTGIFSLLFAYVPIYFLTGLRRAESKVSTITVSILLCAGSAILLSLTNRGNSQALEQQIRDTDQQLLVLVDHAKKEASARMKAQPESAVYKLAIDFSDACNALEKKLLGENETASDLLSSSSPFVPQRMEPELAQVVKLGEELSLTLGLKGEEAILPKEDTELYTKGLLYKRLKMAELHALMHCK